MNRRMFRTLILSTPVLAGVGLLGSVTALVGGIVRAIPPDWDVSAMHGNEAADAVAINPTSP